MQPLEICGYDDSGGGGSLGMQVVTVLNTSQMSYVAEQQYCRSNRDKIAEAQRHEDGRRTEHLYCWDQQPATCSWDDACCFGVATL